MSTPTILPISGKPDPTVRGGKPTGEDAPAHGAINEGEFVAEMVDPVIDPAISAAEPIDTRAEIEPEATEGDAVPVDDALETILQSWSGISSNVASTHPQIADGESVTLVAKGAPSPSRVQAVVADFDPQNIDARNQPDIRYADGMATEGDIAAKPAITLARTVETGLAETASATKLPLEPDAVPLPIRAQETGGTAASPDAPVPRATPVAAQVIRQISDAFVATKDDQIEIALSPEELGRIRMTISGREGGQHVVIWAERPEVLDQLRRNSASLMQEFSDSGMQDMSFEFSDDRPSSRDTEWAPAQIGEPAAPLPSGPPMPQPQAYTYLADGPHIDIRI